MPQDTTSADERTTVGRPRRGPWVAATVLVLALMAAWAVGTPVMTSPDESSHVVKAAAVARGQWSGELGPPPVDRTRPGAGTIVQLPVDLEASIYLPNCIAFRPDATADCHGDLPQRTADLVPVETFAGQYPPLYYFVVGLPSLVLTGETALYGMRLMSAFVSALLVGWAAYRMSTAVGRHLAVTGVVVALTPICLFLGGTVNPIGLEITAALSFWAACLALVRAPGGVATGAMVQAAVSGAVLVNVRDSSPFWAALVVVFAVLVARPGRLREVVRHRAAPAVGVTALLAAAAALSWAALHGSAVSARGLFPEYADPAAAVLAIAGRSYEYLLQMIGNFGWLDTPAPPVTYLAWYVAVGALVLLAASARVRPRARAGVLLALAATALAPFLQLPTMPDAGLIWQGRYGLPLAVGLPLLAAVALDEQRGAADDLVRRAGRGLLPVLAVGHVAAFYWASRRYSEGATGDLFTLQPNWSSPLGYLTGVVLYGALVAAVGVLAWRAMAPTAPRPGQGRAEGATTDAVAVASDGGPAGHAEAVPVGTAQIDHGAAGRRPDGSVPGVGRTGDSGSTPA